MQDYPEDRDLLARKAAKAKKEAAAKQAASKPKNLANEEVSHSRAGHATTLPPQCDQVIRSTSGWLFVVATSIYVDNEALKGVCHEIFDLQFFFMIQTHLGPW